MRNAVLGQGEMYKQIADVTHQFDTSQRPSWRFAMAYRRL
jgi:hypothetical protein